ncbi:MAG: hypothetical protein ACRBBM_15795 [Pseudomonadaceae bacterium]
MKTITALLMVLFAGSAVAQESTAIDDLKRGETATISGQVERILDEDEFRLTDDTGSIRVYVGPNRMPVKTDDVVSVTGFVDDGIGPLELYAHSLTRADGSTVTFSHRYE